MKGVVAAEGRAQAAQLQKRAAELERLADERGSGDEEEPELAPPGGANGGASARLGEVVWAREKGWPAWPALVITKETSRDLATLRAFPFTSFLCLHAHYCLNILISRLIYALSAHLICSACPGSRRLLQVE